MSDARLFADLTSRVETLETRIKELADRVEGKDVSEEVLGPTADPAARDGLRALLSSTRLPQAPEENMPSGGAQNGSGVDAAVGAQPLPESEPPGGLATDPGLREKLAALQGGEASQPAKPGQKK